MPANQIIIRSDEDQAAFDEAEKHVAKGMGQQYVYYQKNDSNPQVQKVRSYIQDILHIKEINKGFDKQLFVKDLREKNPQMSDTAINVVADLAESKGMLRTPTRTYQYGDRVSITTPVGSPRDIEYQKQIQKETTSQVIIPPKTIPGQTLMTKVPTGKEVYLDLTKPNTFVDKYKIPVSFKGRNDFEIEKQIVTNVGILGTKAYEVVRSAVRGTEKSVYLYPLDFATSSEQVQLNKMQELSNAILIRDAKSNLMVSNPSIYAPKGFEYDKSKEYIEKTILDKYFKFVQSNIDKKDVTHLKYDRENLNQRGTITNLQPDVVANNISDFKLRALLDNKTFSERFLTNEFKQKIGYDYNTPFYQDPDVQTFGMIAGFEVLGGVAPKIASVAGRATTAYAGFEFYKEPSYESAGQFLGFAALGSVNKGVKKLVTRSDILTAQSDVQLFDRLKQVDIVLKNQGKVLETVTSKRFKKAGFTKVLKDNIDYTYDKVIQFATPKIEKIYLTSEYFLNKDRSKKKIGRVEITDTKIQSNARELMKEIRQDLIKKEKTKESNIKELYRLAQEQANKENRVIGTISPKRLRGFAQPELELIKVLPKNYKPKYQRFAGYTEEGYKVYTERNPLQNIVSLAKSKINTKGKILDYFAEIARSKSEYLKGGEYIPGEYAKHGKEHLLPMEKYGKYYSYHDIVKVGDIEFLKQYEHGETAAKLLRTGRFPEKTIYDMPFSEQKKLATAFAGHTDVRFIKFKELIKAKNIKSIFTELSFKKIAKESGISTIFRKRSSTDVQEPYLKKTLYYTIKGIRNKELQDIATLDRLDLTRFGIVVRKELLSEKALKRLFSEEGITTKKGIQERIVELNKQAREVKKEQKPIREINKYTYEKTKLKNKGYRYKPYEYTKSESIYKPYAYKKTEKLYEPTIIVYEKQPSIKYYKKDDIPYTPTTKITTGTPPGTPTTEKTPSKTTYKPFIEMTKRNKAIQKQIKSNIKEDKAYTASFTARALGIRKTIKRSELVKEIKRATMGGARPELLIR